MLALSPRSMLSPRFLLPPALALAVIAGLAQARPVAQPADAAMRARSAPCGPEAGAAKPKPDLACRLARDESSRAVLR